MPRGRVVDGSIPATAARYLTQAIESINTPDGSVMLAASSIDAMLKDKSYVEGSLFTRIKKAQADHVLTTDMAEWAHDIRLDANDQRHSDLSVKHASTDDAERVVEFALALGELLYVLPARVRRGRNSANGA